MSNPIQRIVFEHGGDTVTCVVGECIVVDRPQRRRGKVDPYLAPLKQIDSARVVAIEDAGPIYRVTWDPASGPSAWANPFFVGKHDVLHIA
jgi:hypothetical protein